MAECNTQIKLLVEIILCVCVCGWVGWWVARGWKKRKNPDLSGAVKSSRWWRQETSPSGGREWLQSELFRIGASCVGGGVDAWDWSPVTSPMKLSLEDRPPHALPPHRAIPLQFYFEQIVRWCRSAPSLSVVCSSALTLSLRMCQCSRWPGQVEVWQWQGRCF